MRWPPWPRRFAYTCNRFRHGMTAGQPRYLILRGGAIGDFVLTLPAIQALRDHLPHAYLELACYPRVAKLALAGGLVDKATSLDRREFASLFSQRPAFDVNFVEYILGFEVIISYLYDPDRFAINNLNAAGAKTVIYGNPIIDGMHAIDQLCAPLSQLDPPVAPASHVELCLPEKLQAAARAQLSRFADPVIVLHPGSGSPDKNWPLANFVELADRIRAVKLGAPCFSLGEADSQIAKSLRAVAPESAVLNGLELTGLAAVLSHCRGYVGNDSGITHIAAATGIPTVAIFGPTDPALWSPRGRNVTTVCANDCSPDSLATLAVDQVMDALCSSLLR